MKALSEIILFEILSKSVSSTVLPSEILWEKKKKEKKKKKKILWENKFTGKNNVNL